MEKARKLNIFRPLLALIRLLLPLFVFVPTRRIKRTPAELNMPFEDVTLITADNLQLHAWYVPRANARATLLFFHGNNGNVSSYLSTVQIFHELGLSVFIPSYRGYGKSKGSTSIPGTKLDALAAWQWLLEEKKTPLDKIVVFGRSLGGAIAMELMRSVTPRALILESTFSSLADMAPFPPRIARFLLGEDFWNSVEAVTKLTIPTLCIHSRKDRIVPYHQGRRVFEAVASEKTFLEIHGSHTRGFMQSYDIYVVGLDRFFTKIFGEKRQN
ncbi:MAG: lysophospholipase [Spirochaetes bacterium]|nr:lysophospholipase [Spirochaetota bacterium]